MRDHLESQFSRRLQGASLGVITLTSFLLVFIPAYLIRPFIAQTSRGLTIAYFLRTTNPWVTPVLAGIGGLLVLRLWRKCSFRLARVGLAAAVMILAVSAVMSRQNHFEWMFHPMSAPGFAVVSKANHVLDSDMVLGIQIGGESRAYPVRIMAYHHLVNDLVAGQPIVVTY